MEEKKALEPITLLDYFAKYEIMIDYNYDEDEDDFVETEIVGHINEDDCYSDICENAEDRISDYIYDYIEEEVNEGKKGQFLSKLFDKKDIDEIEGVNMFNKYKDGFDDDDERERLLHNLYNNIFDAKFEEDLVDATMKEFVSVFEEKGNLNCIVNDIPLFAIEQIIRAIIYINLDYEGDVHFDMGGGWISLILNVD